MGLFGKLFGGDKTHASRMDHSMMHSGSTNISSAAKGSGMEQAVEHPHPTSTTTIAKDPVCRMDVDISRAATKSEYQGQTYYFCAPGCKTEFDKNPTKYLSDPAQTEHNRGQGNNRC